MKTTFAILLAAIATTSAAPALQIKNSDSDINCDSETASWLRGLVDQAVNKEAIKNHCIAPTDDIYTRDDGDLKHSLENSRGLRSGDDRVLATTASRELSSLCENNGCYWGVQTNGGYGGLCWIIGCPYRRRAEKDVPAVLDPTLEEKDPFQCPRMQMAAQVAIVKAAAEKGGECGASILNYHVKCVEHN